MERKLSINFFGAPCSGKTTFATQLFSDLKKDHYDVEFVPEYAKTLTYENRQNVLKNQLFVFANQYYNMTVPNTKIIINDSPLLLSLIYNKSHENLDSLALECYNEFDNINFYLPIKDNYISKGRNESLEEARLIDDKIIIMFIDLHIPFIQINDYNMIKFHLNNNEYFARHNR